MSELALSASTPGQHETCEVKWRVTVARSGRVAAYLFTRADAAAVVVACGKSVK